MWFVFTPSSSVPFDWYDWRMALAAYGGWPLQHLSVDSCVLSTCQSHWLCSTLLLGDKSWKCSQVVVDEQLLLLQLPGEVVDFLCYKSENFLQGCTTAANSWYTWYLFQPQPPSSLPSWTGDFPCIWKDKTFPKKIRVWGTITLMLVWW